MWKLLKFGAVSHILQACIKDVVHACEYMNVHVCGWRPHGVL